MKEVKIMEWVQFIGFIAVWIVLQRFILPKLGITT